uniref:AT-rich interaction domain 6 n=1 Tax=Kryptolebias marmoratus TaxID=37003 RepID=A0A3Q3B3T1_KRYMA
KTTKLDIQEKIIKDPMEENTEEQFLKNLYLFMKKRDTPIERIPNLGFKQIDLYVMFKTVNEMGGYHKVTSHQLWKRVYNTLGGNPRSTSAATCTRRHYENIYSLPLQFPHFYHPSHPILPPYVPISSSVLTPHTPTVAQPRFHFQPTQPDTADFVKEPLEQLRYLAEQYKTSAGQPLNLSKKDSSWELNLSPISSFSPLLSSKNPKFLNKPSTLYSPHRAGVVRGEKCETQDNESSGQVSPLSESAKETEKNAADDIISTPSNSPMNGRALTVEEEMDVIEVVKPTSSPKTDLPKPREASPVAEGQILPREKEENNMEIEVPLSVVQKWLSMCRGPIKEPLPPDHEVSSRKRSWSDVNDLPTDLTCRVNPQNQSSAEELRLKNEPSLTPNVQSPNQQHSNSQSPFTSCISSLGGSSLKATAIQDIWPFHQQKINKTFNFKSASFWETCDNNSLAPQKPILADSAPKFFGEDPVRGGKERLEMESSAVLMVNSSPASVLHLTTEEVMKLKKIISSSS